MEQWKEEDMHVLLQGGSTQIFFDYFAGKSREAGFEYCAFGMILPIPVSNRKLVFHNNYPRAWWEKYEGNNYLRVDPTVRHALTSTAPILWTSDAFSSALELWEEANSHGLKHGLALPARDARGTIGLLSLARNVQSVAPAELVDSSARMHHMAQVLLVGMTDRILPTALPESLSRLTPREKEVMRWTADGKTSFEIGMILSISIGAVNFHVNNAVAKLDSCNKIQAVVKAVMLGLLT